MPAPHNAQVDQAVQHYRSGNYRKAHKICKGLLQNKPDDHNVMRLLGLVENKRGKSAQGIEWLRKAIGLAPQVPAYYNNLGDIYRSMSRHAEAVEWYRQAIARNPAYALAHNNQGISLAELGRVDEAIRCFEAAAGREPSNPDFHLNLGHALRRQGREQEAEREYARAIEADRAGPEACKALASLCYGQMRYGEALRLYETAIRLAPKDAIAHVRLGDIQYIVGRTEDALDSYQKALDLDPASPEALVGLGHVYSRKAMTDEAIDAYRRALAIRPDAEAAYNGLGNVYGDLGEFDRAAECYRHALALDPEFTPAYRHIHQLGRSAFGDEDLERMQALFEQYSRDNHRRLDLAFALSMVHAERGDHEQSIQYLLTANALARREVDYSLEADEREFREIAATFSSEFIRQHAAAGCDDETPIFIVGMPRSGTSLVEQILSSHPHVHGAGELSSLSDIFMQWCTECAGTLSLSRCMARLQDGHLTEMGRAYVRALRQHDPDAPRITDKMPHNFHHVGLIRLILPRARIIHCRRDPMDTCLSIFRQHFPHRHLYARDLKELGGYYRLYLELMTHWEEVLPGCLHTLRYEDLVAQPERTTRELLEACGLAWDDACLDFHTTQRRVATASNVQVRQKLYTSSVGGWRRYGQHLQPLYDAIHGHGQ